MHKLKWFFVLGFVLLIGCGFLTWWLFHGYSMYTADTISLTYSRSVSSFPSVAKGNFYVRDNVLYFAEDHGDSSIIRYVKNNRIHTFAKLPKKCERFIVLDDKSLIVQIKSSLYLINTSDGKLIELWQGNCVGCYGNLVYFTDSTTLYEAEIGVREPQAVALFEELLASYHDGIVYRNSEGIYQLLFEQVNEPQLLITGDILWPNDKSVWLIGYEYLYTHNYALRISSYALDMYTYKTGEVCRIYEVPTNNMVLMSITARDDELYVSRQYTDLKFWKLENEEINGTYKYCILEDKWTKITNKTYSVIEQFDEQYLYGMRANSLLGGAENIKVN